MGLGEWIVDSEDAYVALAIRLLGDRAALMQAKRELRWRVQNAPIQVGRNYIQEIEGIYCRMWREHCEANKREVGGLCYSAELSRPLRPADIPAEGE